MAEPSQFVPLSPPVFQILLALADRPRHGYGIMKEVGVRTDEAILLSTGTLYSALRRLLDDGLIAETAQRPSAERDDDRRKYYRLTRLGRRVLRAEAERFVSLVGAAFDKKVLTTLPYAEHRGG